MQFCGFITSFLLGFMIFSIWFCFIFTFVASQVLTTNHGYCFTIQFNSVLKLYTSIDTIGVGVSAQKRSCKPLQCGTNVSYNGLHSIDNDIIVALERIDINSNMLAVRGP